VAASTHRAPREGGTLFDRRPASASYGVAVAEGDDVPEDEPAGDYAAAMGAYFADLAHRRDDDALEELRRLLRVRDDGTFEKHIVPRLAARALLRRGPRGVAELVAALPEAPGAIYPNAIIGAIWFAVKGQLGMDFFGVVGHSRELTVPPDDDTSAAAARALRDLFAESRLDNRLFVRLLDFVHSLWMRTTDEGDDVVASEARLLFAEATIKLTPTLLDRFRDLIGQQSREEEYRSSCATIQSCSTLSQRKRCRSSG
jgi:hypothetical protein